MFTTTFKDKILNTMRGSNITAWSVFAGFLTAVTDLEAGTVTEASYSGYARTSAITMTAPAASANGGGRKTDNSALAQGGQKSDAGTVDVIAVGIYDASTVGNLFAISFINAVGPVIATATTSDVLTSPAHGFVDTQKVRVDELVWNNLPGGLSENTEYFVKSSTTDTFALSLSSGGATVDITTSGACAVLGYTPLTIGQNGTPQIQASALVLELA